MYVVRHALTATMHAGTGAVVTPCHETAQSDQILQAILDCENPAKLAALTELLRCKNLEMEAKARSMMDNRPSPPVLNFGGPYKGPLSTIKKEQKEVQSWEALTNNKWADPKTQATTNVGYI
jgi:hypothetical protein